MCLRLTTPALGFTNKGKDMLDLFVVILLVLWLFGLIAGQTFGGLLHIVLLAALVIFLIRLFTGRKVT